MPTPNDVVSPIEHESIANRATCPPDESRISSAQELNQTSDTNASSNVEPTIDAPMQLPTPPPQDSVARAQPPSESHTKPSSAHIEAPSRDIPTPMTATTDDSTEEQRISQASPLSAATPAPTSLLASHLSSPFPAHRVRNAFHNAWSDGSKLLTMCAVSPQQLLFTPPPRKPLQGQPDL